MLKLSWLLLIILLFVGMSACNTAVPTNPAFTEPTALTANSIPEEPTLSAPQPTRTPEPAALPLLPIIGPAPEFQNDVWINTDGPLRLEDLQGKVVLLEFWTFG